MGHRRIQTAGAPTAIGPYSQAIDGGPGDIVACSGQVGLDPASGDLVEGLEAQVRRAMANLGAVLEAAGLGYADVVKTTLFLTDIGDFGTVNAIYGESFSDPQPARSTVAVAALPKGARFEVEAIAVRPRQADAIGRG
ncbi:MAG TPA: Rid family detoxifying hydrolase [Candidatus Limnocylindrales bacterium]|nr:Rid family detoxifying hydrolase [Candidatus Limnocylindrales bacterium]